jgi:hypothetical protein
MEHWDKSFLFITLTIFLVVLSLLHMKLQSGLAQMVLQLQQNVIQKREQHQMKPRR